LVNQFDATILHAFDQIMGKDVNFDKGVEFVSGNDLIQGTFAACVFWWFWFRQGSEATVRRTREHMVATFFGAIVAIAAGRGLALSLPFRIRPRWESTLHYVIPYEADPNVFVNWSSFPSDHAILFTAVAAGFCFVSWRIGLLVYAWYLAVGAFPLMYLGYHYPTDIIAGSLIGVLIGCLANARAIREPLSVPAFKIERASQSAFVVLYFLGTFQIASTFVSLREVALALSRFLGRVI
jgi:undecaprenyl-diphosphatase